MTKVVAILGILRTMSNRDFSSLNTKNGALRLFYPELLAVRPIKRVYPGKVNTIRRRLTDRNK